MATPESSSSTASSPGPSQLNNYHNHSPAAPPVLFVHGFKGCHLLDQATRKPVWISTLQGLGLAPPPKMALPITWKGLVQDRDHIIPGPPMDFMLLGLYKVYGPFLDHMTAKAKKGLIPKFSSYTWDWRRDPMEAAEGLVARLRQEVTQQHRPTQIVCQSMGGMITSMAIHLIITTGGGVEEMKRLIHSVAFVATPFGCGTAFLEDMTEGTAMHNKICDAKTMFTFVTPLSMFPILAGEDESNGWWGEVDHWVDNKCGIFAHQPATPELKQHLANALECGKRVRVAVRSGVTAAFEAKLPMNFLVGDKVPTPLGIDFHKCNPAGIIPWSTMAKVPGDRRVAAKFALPAYLDVSKLDVFHNGLLHHHICDDVVTIDAMLKKLIIS